MHWAVHGVAAGIIRGSQHSVPLLQWLFTRVQIVGRTRHAMPLHRMPYGSTVTEATPCAAACRKKKADMKYLCTGCDLMKLRGDFPKRNCTNHRANGCRLRCVACQEKAPSR